MGSGYEVGSPLRSKLVSAVVEVWNVCDFKENISGELKKETGGA